MRKLPTVILLLAIGGCGNASYPPEVVSNFMSSCSLTSGGNTAMCSCMIKEIQSSMSFEKYINLETRLTVGDKNAEIEFVNVISSCRR